MDSASEASGRPSDLELRKRPLQARSAALVAAILDAAAHILEREGPAALTTNRVAERAGVSIGSLYQYFPNRDAILVKLAIRTESALRAKVEAAFLVADPRDLRSGLRSLVAIAVEHHLAAPRLHAVLAEAEARLGPLRKDELAGAEDRMSDLIGAYLTRVDPERMLAAPWIAREVEVVGHTLVSEALRTGRFDEDAQMRIAAILARCVET